MTHISSNFDSNKSMSPEVTTFTVQKNPQGTQQKQYVSVICKAIEDRSF